jgi:hypothetical protein
MDEEDEAPVMKNESDDENETTNATNEIEEVKEEKKPSKQEREYPLKMVYCESKQTKIIDFNLFYRVHNAPRILLV